MNGNGVKAKHLPVENCPEPPSVDNSILFVEEAEGPVWLTYLCLEGYHLEGSTSLFCNASKDWDAPPPSCRLGHCPEPVLSNGEFIPLGPMHINDIVTFQCKDQYILKGSNWSQCLEDHTWKPPLPICKSRHCGPPGNLVHGYFEGNDFSLGSNITFYCEKKYRLVGTQHQQCVDGEWSSTLPRCERLPQTELEKALFAFQESKDFCQAIKTFMQRLSKSGLIMEQVKYSLQVKKAELERKRLLQH
ncbi:PREDICTED: C4b-binding protein beta chain [Elephantulus edwardii]|uniref:C4b-binding protein beta chain n=1 Tax=Elephantulus edwardii TaxID=28737 RepID=UPI0003F0980B|nr:PREDICTED: C4b-binding protein beta chain [Elephantulus edwardii]